MSEVLSTIVHKQKIKYLHFHPIRISGSMTYPSCSLLATPYHLHPHQFDPCHMSLPSAPAYLHHLPALTTRVGHFCSCLLGGVVSALPMRVFHTFHQFFRQVVFSRHYSHISPFFTHFLECFSKLLDIEGGHPLKWVDPAFFVTHQFFGMTR